MRRTPSTIHAQRKEKRKDKKNERLKQTSRAQPRFPDWDCPNQVTVYWHVPLHFPNLSPTVTNYVVLVWQGLFEGFYSEYLNWPPVRVSTVSNGRLWGIGQMLMKRVYASLDVEMRLIETMNPSTTTTTLNQQKPPNTCPE